MGSVLCSAALATGRTSVYGAAGSVRGYAVIQGVVHVSKPASQNFSTVRGYY
jgi:hypothetical protein